MEMASFVSHLCFPFVPSLFAVQKQQHSSIIMLLLLLCVWPSRHRVSTWYLLYGLGLPVPVVIGPIGGTRTYYVCAATRYLSNIQHVGLQGTSTRYSTRY